MTTTNSECSQLPPNETISPEISGESAGKRLLWLATLGPLLLASIAYAMPSKPLPPLSVSKSRPALLFATYMYHHGDEAIELEPTLESEFRFRNEGTEPVRIISVERSCGCMVPRYPKEVAPGETASLQVPLQTINQTPGPHEYTLTVHYEDPQPRQTTLTIKAVFPEKMVVVQPKALYLSQKSEKSFPLPTVSISDYRDTPLKVNEVFSSATFISAGISRGASAEIIQTSFTDSETPHASTTNIAGEVAGSIPAGRHHALIAAATNDPDFPYVVVPMVVNGPAYPQGQAPIVSPSQLRFVASDHPNAQRKARVQIIVPAAWEFTHATAWPDQLSVEYKETDGANDAEKMLLVDVELTELPAAKITDGIVQLYANGGRNLITTKVTFLWP